MAHLLLGSSSAAAEPTEPILEILDPMKKATFNPVVLFMNDTRQTPGATNPASQPVNLARGASLYGHDIPPNQIPAETRVLFQTFKHDKTSTICGWVWKQPQVVTQVILQWPEDAPMPEVKQIAIRWSVAGTLREAIEPGIIGNGRQWVYTLDPNAKPVKLDNLVVAARDNNLSIEHFAVPTLTIVGH